MNVGNEHNQRILKLSCRPKEPRLKAEMGHMCYFSPNELMSVRFADAFVPTCRSEWSVPGPKAARPFERTLLTGEGFVLQSFFNVFNRVVMIEVKDKQYMLILGRIRQ